MAETGLLDDRARFGPQHGMLQNKIPGEDLWDHTMRAVDAPPASRPVVRLAALLMTSANRNRGRRPASGHESVGAEDALALFARSASTSDDDSARSRRPPDPEPHVQLRTAWKRFPRSFGSSTASASDALEELFAAPRGRQDRQSGLPREAGRLDELRARIASELAAGAVLARYALAIDGDAPDPRVGLSSPGPIWVESGLAARPGDRGSRT